MLRCSATLQSVTALSSAEAEYYAISKGAAYSLGTQSYLRDLGRFENVEIHTDSSSAKSFAARRGLGRLRHVQTRYLWVQERLACKHLRLFKVPGDENPADAMTKSLASSVLEKHLRFAGQRFL